MLDNLSAHKTQTVRDLSPTEAASTLRYSSWLNQVELWPVPLDLRRPEPTHQGDGMSTNSSLT
ncbi:MAG: hypothetical protein JWN34_3821 [Bryobacterales bacterium]|nr:hypothetical protein [Bryobacterales bacterium]